MPASSAILATFSAITKACISLSMTHGPAIRNNGFPPPRRKEPRLISLPAVMRSFEDSTEAGGVAKAARAAATCQHRGDGKGDACEPCSLLVDAADDEDRKSTRLNSSHVAISYAVFCL